MLRGEFFPPLYNKHYRLRGPTRGSEIEMEGALKPPYLSLRNGQRHGFDAIDRSG